MGAAEGTKMDDDFVEMERVTVIIEYLVWGLSVNAFYFEFLDK